ncbi:MAG: Coenzyme F420 hydrogenase/dehydrogenase, beta subunit C-terminal domain, partial [Nitrososphaerales archaeon]
VVKNDYCIGCGACAAVENSPIKIKLDEFGRYRPFIVPDSHGMDINVMAVCPFSDQSRNEDQLASSMFARDGVYDGNLGYVAATYAGYVKEGDYRTNGSSGGIGSWILAELLQKGLVDRVIHVHPKIPSINDTTLFHYSISSTADEVGKGSRSHYYPVEMSGILKYVRETPGAYALVGIPCFLKAVRLLMLQDPIIGQRIKYCIGLVCGYLPSTKFADLFAWQAGIHPNDLIQINFRKKDPDRPANRYSVEINGTKTVPFGSTFGSNWGNGFFKHKACDYCDDVVSETADITIGDAWLPKYVGDSQGTNIVIVRNPDMHAVITQARQEGRLHLEHLTPAEVIESQAPAFR